VSGIPVLSRFPVNYVNRREELGEEKEKMERRINRRKLVIPWASLR